ncbi:TPA: sel1 repeat family protein [Escherichia coli]|uniref:tetratricopeptide repeat protein n=1 Tax=Escherichia coli TaxID=562 RepID=UPI0003A78170|nr:tetratricopeptide repeat protein [Escherichia coli]HAH9728816.1 sel1 repeat family protein [Escherichia coli]
MKKMNILSFITLIMSLITTSAAFANLDEIHALGLKASRGDATANFELAKRLENGHGTEKNLGQAIFYYKRAIHFGKSEEARKRFDALRSHYNEIEALAKAGDVQAQYDFATILAADPDYENFYPRRNEPKSTDWYQRAARQGYRPAQKALAAGYARGQRGKPDTEQSLHWYSTWAQSGSASDQLEFAELLDKYPFLLLKNKNELKKKWLTESANNGSAEGMLQLGYFLRDEEKNETESFNWFLKSAKKGNVSGQFAVGMKFLHEGKIEEAINWLEQSAKNGSMWAQEKLGEVYEEIEPVDPERAFFWYQKAAKQGHTYAAYRVCHYLHNGITVTKDTIAAWAWCSIGADATPDSGDERDIIAKELSSSELQKAQRMYEKLQFTFEN